MPHPTDELHRRRTRRPVALRLVAVLAVLTLLAAACGGDDDDAAPATTAAAETPDTTEAQAPATTDAPMGVGSCVLPDPLTEADLNDAGDGELTAAFIYVGPIADAGWNFAHNQGRLYAEENVAVTTVYSEAVEETEAAFRAVAEDHIQNSGADIIFGTSFGYMDAMEAMALEYPDVVFEHASGFKMNDTNFGNYFGRIYQPRYLSGLAAGSVEGIDRIGYVAAFPIPEVIRGINAFTLGAREVNPDVEVEVRWTSTWFDPTVEGNTARALVESGADLLAQHQDSTAVGQVAEAEGLRWVSYNTDMCNFGPAAHVTAPIWNWGPYYERTIRAVADGSYTPGSYWGGLDDDIVALGSISPDIDDDTRDLIEQRSAQMRDGSWDVFTGPLNNQDGEQFLGDGETMGDGDMLGMSFFVEGVIGSTSG